MAPKIAHQSEKGWEFWIDRGGTFTDIVARLLDGMGLGSRSADYDGALIGHAP